MKSVRVRVGLPGDSSPAADRSYDILIGPDVLAETGDRVAGRGGRRCVLITDAAVAATHAARTAASLTRASIDVSTVVVPSGEASKSVEQLERIWNAMAAHAVDRATHVVAVGGGVVGDLAGFAAASYARGLPFWQVPTTLVAQVDSSVGGKTGINLAAGKNLVGAFWQPLGVACDPTTLATLPSREFTSGLAEVVKYGVILDEAFFAWIEDHADAILSRDADALGRVVAESCRLKASVVERDERELTGLRAILNYGHTFAHAFEAASGYGRLLHGEAVAVGMHAAAMLAKARGLVGADFVDRQRSLLGRLGLPVTCPEGLAGETDQLIEAMLRDKKSIDGRLRFVLPSRFGRVELIDGITAATVRDVLASVVTR